MQRIITDSPTTFNTLRGRQNGHHFAHDIFMCISLNKNFRKILNEISLGWWHQAFTLTDVVDHQWGHVAFTWGKFHRKRSRCPWYQFKNDQFKLTAASPGTNQLTRQYQEMPLPWSLCIFCPRWMRTPSTSPTWCVTFKPRTTRKLETSGLCWFHRKVK